MVTGKMVTDLFSYIPLFPTLFETSLLFIICPSPRPLPQRGEGARKCIYYFKIAPSPPLSLSPQQCPLPLPSLQAFLLYTKALPRRRLLCLYLILLPRLDHLPRSP